MKINVKHLLDSSGIDCFRISTGGPEGHEHFKAKAAFVTEETVDAAREAAALAGERPEPGSPDVRYGDVLVSWRDGAGWQGTHAKAGQDAGVYLSIHDESGRSTVLPFTGMSMFLAHQKLRPRELTGRIDEHQQRVLDGIRGVFDVVVGAILDNRFPDGLTGMVFACRIAGDGSQPHLDVEAGDFARHAKASMIRARIEACDPDHPEAAGGCDSLDEILARVIGKPIGPVLRPGMGTPIDEPFLRKIAAAAPGMSDRVLGSLSRADVKRMSARALNSEDMALFSRGASRRKLSGAWVEAANARLGEMSENLGPDAAGQIEIFNIGRRDIVAIRDSMSDQSGSVFLYSWPDYDRTPVSRVNGSLVFHLSPEEVPSKLDLVKLRSALDELEYGPLAGRQKMAEEALVS